MTLFLKDPIAEPGSLTPNGGRVRFFFHAHASRNDPTHMRAKFWIDDEEKFVFSPPGGGTTKQVFFPSVNTQDPTPSTSSQCGPKATTIVPEGRPDPTRFGLLRINVELQGYDAGGNPVPGQLRKRPLTIKLDAVSMALGVAAAAEDRAALAEIDPVCAALRIVSNSLGISQVQISKVLDVHPDTVGRVLRGENSPKVREALERIFKGD